MTSLASENPSAYGLCGFKAISPDQSKSTQVVNTALASTGKGVPRNREEAMHLLAKVASLGDDKAQKWIDTNCPGKPDWLKALRQTSLEDDARK